MPGMAALSRKTKIGIGVAIGVLALALGGIGTAYALGGDRNPVSGATADRARAAAVQAVAEIGRAHV